MGIKFCKFMSILQNKLGLINRLTIFWFDIRINQFELRKFFIKKSVILIVQGQVISENKYYRGYYSRIIYLFNQFC